MSPTLLGCYQLLDSELEKDLQFSTFETYKLYRGQQLGDSALLRDAYRSVGIFKVRMSGLLRVPTCSQLEMYHLRMMGVVAGWVAVMTVVVFRAQGTIRVVDSANVEPLFDLDQLFRPKPVVVGGYAVAATVCGVRVDVLDTQSGHCVRARAQTLCALLRVIHPRCACTSYKLMA